MTSSKPGSPRNKRIIAGLLAVALAGLWLCRPHASGLAWGKTGFDPQPGAAQPPVAVVVELAAPPVAQVYLDAQAEGAVSPAALSAVTQLHLAAVEAQQLDLLENVRIQGVDVDVLYRNQRVYNGVGILVNPEHLETLAAMPEVVAVHPLTLHAPATSISVPHIHAPELWQGRDGAAGLTGAGVRVAVIDTGIDYLHTAFGGPGRGYEHNDPNLLGDAPNFPGVKVAGGWDFAGDSYNADPDAVSYSPFPQPNPDPMDCYGPGHGTHVAAILGGYGVTAAGATYRGPYVPDLNPADFRMGPGVAPQVQLYALKVFGCQGMTALVDAAIEWAVDPNRDGDLSDRMDVINLSLGSGYGAPYDPTTVAADNAARLGIVVVASAGNNGDTVYAVGAPGVAEAAISVAATRLESNDCPAAPCLPVARMADYSARGPRRGDSSLKPDLAAPGHAIVSARTGVLSRDGTQVVALSGTSMAAPHVAGAAALLLQSASTGASREDGFVWRPSDVKARLMNTAQPDITMGGEPPAAGFGPPRVGAGRIDLSAALATQAVAFAADSPGGVSLSFGAPPVVDALQATRNIRLANRGPYSLTFAVRYSPVMTTPGVEIAIPGVSAGNALTVTVGPYGAATVPVLLAADAQAMRLSRDPTLNPIATFPRHWLTESAGYLIFAPVAPDDSQLEPEAAIEDAIGQPALRVPIYAAPQAASVLQALPQRLDFGNTLATTTTLSIVGQGIASGCPPDCLAGTAPFAVASLLELHYQSGRAQPVAGLPNPTFAHADLHYLGVGRGQTSSGPVLYFGIATHGPWSTLNEVEFNIWIDIDNDRRADYRLFNAEQSGYTNGLWSEIRGGDVFVSVLEDLATGERVLADFVNGISAAMYPGGVYNTNVILLPLPLHLADWEEAGPALNYRVSTYSRTFGNHPLRSPVVDATPWLRYQLTPPALTWLAPTIAGASGSPLIPADRGAHIELDYRAVDFVVTGPRGLLFFYHTNHPDHRVQAVPIRFLDPFRRFAPTVGRAAIPGN